MPSTLRQLLQLAWPIVVSRSAQTVIGVSDAVMVAHMGQTALAATTTGSMNTFTAFILPMGVSFIVSSFASQLHGAGDAAGARRFGWYGLGLAVVAQVLCWIGMPLVVPVLGRLGYAPDVQALMADYMAIRLWSGGAAIGIEALGNYFGGIGNTQLPMRANVFAMVCNVFGNWMLIDGHLGMPAMGVRGAALASAVSTWLAFLFVLAMFLVRGRGLPKMRWRWTEFWRMVRFGAPSGVNWFLEFMAFMFFVNIVVGGLGTTALAAMMAVIQINSVSFMPAFGLASAGAILVGQSIGGGDKDGVPRLVRTTFLVSAAWQGTVGLAYVLMPALLFAPFAKGSPAEAQALLAVGGHMLVLSSLWQLFDSAVAVVGEALRAAGDTAFAMWARTAVGWLVFAPGSWMTVRHFGHGADAAILWIVGYMALLAVVLLARFRSGAWRRIALIDGLNAPTAA